MAKPYYHVEQIGGTTEDITTCLQQMLLECDQMGYDPAAYIDPPMRDAVIVVFKARRRERKAN